MRNPPGLRDVVCEAREGGSGFQIVVITDEVAACTAHERGIFSAELNAVKGFSLVDDPSDLGLGQLGPGFGYLRVGVVVLEVAGDALAADIFGLAEVDAVQHLPLVDDAGGVGRGRTTEFLALVVITHEGDYSDDSHGDEGDEDSVFHEGGAPLGGLEGTGGTGGGHGDPFHQGGTGPTTMDIFYTKIKEKTSGIIE